MFWMLVRLLCAGSFVINGFKSFSCTSVSIGGGRVLQTTCFDDHTGGMSGPAGGILQLLIGSAILVMPTLFSKASRTSAQAEIGASWNLNSTQPSIYAEQLVRRLRADGLPIQLTHVYTKETDPNGALGKPGAYYSKAAFSDSRIQLAGSDLSASGSVLLGGSLEIFHSAEDAYARARHIQTTLSAAGTKEFDYVRGGVLLRLSERFDQEQAEQYESRLVQALASESFVS